MAQIFLYVISGVFITKLPWGFGLFAFFLILWRPKAVKTLFLAVFLAAMAVLNFVSELAPVHPVATPGP